MGALVDGGQVDGGEQWESGEFDLPLELSTIEYFSQCLKWRTLWLFTLGLG